MLLRHEPNFAYESFLGRNGTCDLKVYENKGRTICLVTELDSNLGPSVTNSAELIYDKLSQKYDDFIMVEHYPHDSFGVSNATWDVVTVTNGHASWKHITKGEWLTLCGE